MSYIPDYRSEDNESYLNTEDRSFLDGYRKAINDLRDFFYQPESQCDFDLMAENFDDFADVCDRETTCWVFDFACNDYIPEDAEIKDMNPKFHAGEDN